MAIVVGLNSNILAETGRRPFLLFSGLRQQNWVEVENDIPVKTKLENGRGQRTDGAASLYATMPFGAFMQKIDVKKRYQALFSAPIGEFIVLDVPPLTYFAVDGVGNPNTAPEYRAAVEALYTTSYTLKFMNKDSLRSDYIVPPLEGLWWADDMADFVARRKDRWKWRMMILVPDFVEEAMAKAAIARAKEKKKLPGLAKLFITRLEEGQVAQTLHVGSYDDEGPILKRLHDEFMPKNGLAPTGHHHEVYLSDPRKTPANRLKTVLRQPVRSLN